jgi:hypothetical protein
MPSVLEVLNSMDYGKAPESNAQILEWLAFHKEGFSHFIGGGYLAAKASQKINVYNPHNNERLAQVTNGKKLMKRLLQHAKHLRRGRNFQVMREPNISMP